MPLTPRTVSFTTDFAPEQRRIDDNRRLAEQLQREAAQPLATGITAPGGYFVPTNPLQHLAQTLKGVNARLYREQADEQDRSVSARRNEAMSAALRNMPQARTVTEDTSGEGTGSFDMSGSAGPQTASVRPGMAENAAWMGQLAQVSPQAVQMGSTLLGMQQRADEAGENRAFRAEESAANRAARLQDRQMQIDLQIQQGNLNREQTAVLTRERMENNARITEAQIQARLDAMRFAAGNRQQSQPQVLQTADGPMILGPNGEARPITGPGGQQVRAASGRAGPMSATAQKELLETEESMQGSQAALSLLQQARNINNKAMGFTGAGAVASAGSLLPESMRPKSVDATQELDNILQSQALPQLKAIFGGMPTEGERKILLDVQGSSSKPASVRKGIFDRAEEAIKNRLKFNQEKSQRLRSGTYFTGEGLPSLNPSGDGQPPKINNDADFNALPSGSMFIAPDGSQRRKP